MRTTIDLPDPLYRELKSTAARQGVKLKDFISAALRASIAASAADQTGTDSLLMQHRARMNEHFSRMDAGRSSHTSVSEINRESLHDRHD